MNLSALIALETHSWKYQGNFENVDMFPRAYAREFEEMRNLLIALYSRAYFLDQLLLKLETSHVESKAENMRMKVYLLSSTVQRGFIFFSPAV